MAIKNLLWNFSVKWFLREGCLKWKFQPDRFLNFRCLYTGYYCISCTVCYRLLDRHFFIRNFCREWDLSNHAQISVSQSSKPQETAKICCSYITLIRKFQWKKNLVSPSTGMSYKIHSLSLGVLQKWQCIPNGNSCSLVYVQQIVIWTFGLVEKANLVILREKPPDQLKNHFLALFFPGANGSLKYD